MRHNHQLIPFFFITFLILSIFSPFIISNVEASDTLYEYYNTNDDTALNILADQYQGQTFTPAENHTITSVKAKMFKVGTVGVGTTITFQLYLCNATDHRPTGDVLTSGTLDASTFTTNTAGVWYEWQCTEYTLTEDIEYAIVFLCPSLSGGNYISWRCDASSPSYTGGGCVYSGTAGVSWNVGSYSTIDDMFEIYGNEPSEPTQYNFEVISDYGTPNPTVGNHLYDDGENVTATMTTPYIVDEEKQYVCTGYTGTGSCGSGSGTTTNFIIDENSTITWNWELTSIELVSIGSVNATTGASISKVFNTVEGDYVLAGWTQINGTERPDLATVTPTITGGTLTLLYRGGIGEAYSALYGGFTNNTGSTNVTFAFSGGQNHPFDTTTGRMLMVVSSWRGINQDNPHSGASYEADSDLGDTSPISLNYTVTPLYPQDGQLYVSHYFPMISSDSNEENLELNSTLFSATNIYNQTYHQDSIYPFQHYGISVDSCFSDSNSLTMGETWNFTEGFTVSNPFYSAIGLALNNQTAISTNTLTMQINYDIGTGACTLNPTVGDHEYTPNSNVTLTATSDDNYEFDHWQITDIGTITDNPYTLNMTSDYTATAYFTLIPLPENRSLVMNNPSPLAGGDAPTPTVGTQVYSQYENVTLIAGTPNTGYIFGYWKVNGTNYSALETVDLNMTDNWNVTPIYNITMNIVYIQTSIPSEAGIIIFSGGTVTTTEGGVYALVPYGTEVSFIATEYDGWVYQQMLIGDVNGTQIDQTTARRLTYTVTEDISIIATFRPITEGEFQWTVVFIDQLLIPLLILLLPAIVLMLFLGKWGFFGGLGLMLVVGTFIGIIPYWLIIVISLALAILLFEQYRKRNVGEAGT